MKYDSITAERRKYLMQILRENGDTLEQIGSVFDLTKERVRQILGGAKLNKIKEELYYLSKFEIQSVLQRRVEENQKANPIGQYLINIKKSAGGLNGGRDRLRELVRLRDGNVCQWCGKRWEQGKRRFDVHHIYGGPDDSHRYDRDFNVQITLCHQCHLRIDAWKMEK